MQHLRHILILAGKQVDEETISQLSKADEVSVARYTTVSRGVSRLESVKPNLVFLVPDLKDTSWERAVRRIREEYGIWVILVGHTDLIDRPRAMDAGAYDAFTNEELDEECFLRLFSYVERQLILEAQLAEERTMRDWVEQTARIGSWCSDSEGKTIWSDGYLRILEDQGDINEDFESVRSFVHPDDLEIFDQANKATFEKGWPLDFEYRIQTGNDAIRSLHLHRRIDYGDDGTVARVYGMCHDVTPEREFENFLFRRDAILQAVGHLAEQFLSSLDWEPGLQEALTSLGKATEVTRTFIFQKKGRDLATAEFDMIMEWTLNGIEPTVHSPLTQKQTFSSFEGWKRVMSNRKTVAGNIRNFQKHEREFFQNLGTKSLLLVPIFVGDNWWGFLGLAENRRERDWMPGEISSMKMVGNLLGAAILRASMDEQLKEANLSAEESRLDAQEASQAKSRFLANMSHEIRTPISGILGMAEMTITTGLTTEQREHMDMIRDAARSLLAIVNDVLDISKIEADKMELKTEDFELRPLLDTMIRSFTPMVEEKTIDLNLAVDSNIPAFVHGDPERLGQILRNLISNALKFTEHGHVNVSVEVEEHEDKQIRLLFKVADSGEGISEEMLDTVFDSFTQADSSVRKKYQGTGLGLTISRELVQMMKGVIRVESRLGVGSTFSFTVLLGVPKQTARKAGGAEALMPRGMHLNILMAEDNPLNQKFLTHFLSMFGHKVTVAENGLKALEALKRMGKDVDLVLMDIQMPEMGGMEATRAIRESDGRLFDQNIPIIALTAYAMKGDKERMFDVGMDDYVSKPVDMKELSSAIARAMALRSEPAASKGAAMPSGHKAEPAKPVEVTLDMDSLIERFHGNMELLREILDLFMSESETKLAVFDAAFAVGNLEELGAAAHSITNMSSHVLAMDIVYAARALEKQCYRGTLEDVTPGVESLRPRFVALVEAVRHKAETL